ncbi:unnamed protein product [Amoebophrya sp. A120]|nr:unnamed protein product [Amoebophrya sp. A120]|eukprot:GSA120T00021204001.1
MYGFEVEYSGVSRSRAAVLAEQDSSIKATSSTSVQNSSVAGEDKDEDHLPQEKQPVEPARASGDIEVGSGEVVLARVEG